MGTMINLSNHSSKAWGEDQLQEAKKYGDICDIPFPLIPANLSDEDFDKLVKDYFQKVMDLNPAAVMVQGEFVFTYRMVCLLKEAGVKAVAACTERRAVERVLPTGETEKTSVFSFVRFREY